MVPFSSPSWDLMWKHGLNSCFWEEFCSVLASHWMRALGSLWEHHWQAMVGHPDGSVLPGNFGWALSQQHRSGGGISIAGA